MRTTMVGVPLLAALLGADLAVAAETDIFGRQVPDGRGRYTLVLYSNDDTKDAADVPSTELSVRLYDVPILVLVRADLRGVPGIFEGIARRIMRGKYEDGLKRYRARFKELGLTLPKDPEGGLFMVLDSYGKAHQAIGLPKGFTEAFMIVLDPNGKEIARGPFPRMSDAMEAAVRRDVKKATEKQAVQSAQ